MECVDQSPPEVMARQRGDEAGGGRGTSVGVGVRAGIGLDGIQHFSLGRRAGPGLGG
jgi:hypothetical protein